MLEKWKSTNQKDGFVYAMFMKLSKAFDTMNHDLLIAKWFRLAFKKMHFLSWKDFHEKAATSLCQ